MFAIAPEALNSHAKALRDLAASVTDAQAYATEHLALDVTDTAFLFERARESASATLSALSTYQSALRTALTSSASELDSTAARSVALDDAIEAELDKQYPDPIDATAPLVPPSSNAVYTVPSDPGSNLTAPSALPSSDLVSQILTTDWLSPSTDLAQIISWIFDWNPIDEITKCFSGDWDSLYRVSSALQHLAQFQEGQGDSVIYAMSVSATSWKGQASTAANAFFAAFGANAKSVGSSVRELAPSYEAVAKGMKASADLLAGILAQIMDAAIVALICYAAGTALAETGVGAIVGYLAGSGTIAYMAWLAGQAWDVIQDASTFFTALTAAVGVAAQFLDGAQVALPLPQAYDNPEL